MKNITEKGMRILTGIDAERQEAIIEYCTASLRNLNFSPIILPTIEPRWIYDNKLGSETTHQTFKVESKRDLILRPEGTATIQAWAKENWQSLKKNTKVYYVSRCFRQENPQRGRYREFTQFGVEVLKPTEDWDWETRLPGMAEMLVKRFVDNYQVNACVSRGLDYYIDGEGFEIECDSLGSQKQIVGGGAYQEGIGFALGVDRLALCANRFGVG